MRREKVKPELDKAYDLINSLRAGKGSNLGMAITYARNQKDKLYLFLEDPKVEMSNNLAERTVKPYVFNRKNFLSIDTEKGADASAAVMSIIETAKRNELDVYGYLLYLLTALPIVNGTLIDAQDAKGNVVLPSEVKYVAASAFARNMDVTSVVYPESVYKIADNTFFYCSNLTSVEAKGATTIENMAFAYCDKLTSLKLSEKLKSIDGYGFSDAKGTATITFYGTKESWDAVEKSENDQFLQRATVVFEEYVPTSGTELKKGDANSDGSVDMSDVVMVMQACLNPQKYGVNGTSPDCITAEGEKAGDVDGKEGLSANDALIIQRYTLKLIDTL